MTQTMAKNKRNILLITTDQMRFDALGCNGGRVARTPCIDSLAAEGINYKRAHNNHVVCMPARASIITGQHVGTHGVWMNGVTLPEDYPTVAHALGKAGYNTALIGKAHFEPWLGSPDDFYENRMAQLGERGPHRGFDHMELANHFFEGHSHFDLAMNAHPDVKARFYPMITERGQNIASTGETGAVQVWPMDVPRDLYHTDWVADRTLAWLGEQGQSPWFCWMSFPDPHHPWDVPRSELHRVNWRDLDLPPAYLDGDEARRVLGSKPKHWLGYYEASLWSNLESPRDYVPADMTPDQVREINAMTHIENELIDEACQRVIDYLKAHDMYDHTDIFFTTDHGELQGDYGLMFKGPYHVDALMRLPFIWKPGQIGVEPQVIDEPVGHVDLAPTFCAIAGIEPEHMDGGVLPTSADEASQQGRETTMTEWASEHGPVNLSLESLYHKDGWLITRYHPGSVYEGTEGELYQMTEDPLQMENRWDDPSLASVKSDLLAELSQAHIPMREPKRPRLAPV